MKLITRVHKYLQVGGYYKNYKVLCAQLREKPLSHNDKIAQLKEWHTCFEWTKEGQQITVTEIYDAPKVEINHKSKYYDLLSRLIICMIRNVNDDTLAYSAKSIFRETGMVNENYKTNDNNVYQNVYRESKQQTDYALTTIDISKFFDVCDSTLKEMLNRVLSEMQNAEIIKYKWTYKIAFYKNVAGKYRIVKKVVTAKEAKYIHDTEKKLLQKYQAEYPDKHIQNKRDIKLRGLLNSFYNDLNEIYKKEQNWNMCYKCCKIKIINQEETKRLYIAGKSETLNAKKEMNQLTYDCCLAAYQQLAIRQIKRWQNVFAKQKAEEIKAGFDWGERDCTTDAMIVDKYNQVAPIMCDTFIRI